MGKLMLLRTQDYVNTDVDAKPTSGLITFNLKCFLLSAVCITINESISENPTIFEEV